MVLGLTNGVFNIVALDPLFSALGWEEFMDLSSRDEEWSRPHVVYRGLFDGKSFFCCILEWKVVDFV